MAHTPLWCEAKEDGVCLEVYASRTLELCPNTRENVGGVIVWKRGVSTNVWDTHPCGVKQNKMVCAQWIMHQQHWNSAQRQGKCRCCTCVGKWCAYQNVAHTPLWCEATEVVGSLVAYAPRTLELCPKTREIVGVEHLWTGVCQPKCLGLRKAVFFILNK